MRKLLKRSLLGALVLLLALGTWLGWQTYAVYRGLQHITHVVVPRTTAEPTISVPPLNGNQRFNILVLGSDNDRKPEEKDPLTQSMIVVTIDPLHRKVGMLSIPRDFWVPIRGHGMAKIDLANKYGGVALARETVEKLFHVPIDGYAWVGLSGFTKVIDTFNGITLNVNHPILDDFYPDDLKPGDPYAFTRVFIPPGWRHLSGRQALEYVRSRHGDLVGDFGRSTRQQQILTQLRQKLSGLNILTNITGLVQDLQDSVKTDLDLPQLYDLGKLSRHITEADIHKVVLAAPTYCTPGTSADGQYILRPNWARIQPVLKSMFAPIVRTEPGSPHPGPPSGHPAPHPGTNPKAAPHPTPTPAPYSSNTLPGSIVFDRDGNIFELTRNRAVRQLTNTGAIAMPSISPDGKTLAIVRFPRQPASDIWLLNRRTGAMRQVTSDINMRDVHNDLWAAWPSWRPDGKSLLFSYDRQKLSQAATELRPVDLAVWQAAGGQSPVQLSLPVRYSGGDTDPQWRPNTQQFMYVRWNFNPHSSEPFSQIVLHDPATANPWELTPPNGRVIQPALDRSGNRLVYLESTDNWSQIISAAIVNTPKGPQLRNRVVIAGGKVAQPAFSPGGRWVTFLKADGDKFSLYIVSSRGGPAVQIPEAGSGLDAISRPVWTP